MTEVDRMNKEEKPRKESNPINDTKDTDSSIGIDGKTQQQKSAQKSVQSNDQKT